MYFKSLLKSSIANIVLLVILFLAANTLRWGTAWVYAALVFAATIFYVLCIPKELVEERAGLGEGVKKWDIFLALWIARLGPALMMLTAGLNHRFAWKPQVGTTLQVIGVLLLLAGYLLTTWAMVSNRFFSGVVRIQSDRGHSVASGGPYRFIRHPGYAGIILYSLGTPLMLRTAWALVPAAAIIAVTVVRTYLEDRTLYQELDGYTGYTQRVKSRLVPGIW